MFSLAFIHGVALCASLIATIGAQNAFVLRQGLLRAHVGKIIMLCIVSDFILIGAGVAGASALMERAPVLVHALLYVGLAYLAWFGFSALRRAMQPGHATLEAHQAAAAGQSAGSVMLMTLAFTWLNPHVYLDTFLLLGTAGAREPEGTRFAFVLGAASVSLVWFLALGYGARLLAPWFKRPSAWRTLDAGIGTMVLAIAATQLR